MNFKIWSQGIHWAPGTSEVDIELLQEAAIDSLKEYCPHIIPDNLTIHYGDIRDQPTVDEDGNTIPVTSIFQEIWIECVKCYTGENDGMG